MIALADRGVLELAQVEVHLGRRALHQGQGVDQLERHPVLADLEVLERALGLRPQSRSAGTFISPIVSVSMRNWPVMESSPRYSTPGSPLVVGYRLPSGMQR